MRLIKSGIKSDSCGKEIWLYPFYLDEKPVSVQEMHIFIKEKYPKS